MDVKVPDSAVLEAATSKYAAANREANSLKIRLETESIKEKISIFLRGEVKVYKFNEQTGMPTYSMQSSGHPKVNEVGYQAIMSFVESLVNKSTVMGNFEQTSDLYDFLRRTRKPFVKDLFINLNEYGIKVTECNGMINNIYALVEPFMTRTIGDGERATIRETTIQQDRVVSGQKFSFNPLKMLH